MSTGQRRFPEEPDLHKPETDCVTVSGPDLDLVLAVHPIRIRIALPGHGDRVPGLGPAELPDGQLRGSGNCSLWGAGRRAEAGGESRSPACLEAQTRGTGWDSDHLTPPRTVLLGRRDAGSG